MAKIKTIDAVKGTIKTIDKAAVASERMKSAYTKTKDKAEQSCYAEENSATEYAADKVSHTAERVTAEGVYQFDKQGQKSVRTTKENIVKAKDKAFEFKQKRMMKTVQSQRANAAGQNGSQFHYGTVSRSSASNTSVQRVKGARQTQKTIKQSARNSKNAIKTAAKGTVKTTQKSVKTAQATSKTAIKTTQTTAKSAQAAAKASAKTAQKAAQAARATAKASAAAVKTTAKATVSAVKAIIAGTKALIAAIVAGGWVAVIIILIVVLLGCAVSLFGGGGNSNAYTPVSAEVEAYDPLIRQYASQHGIPEYVELIKAVMMQESGGRGNDPMQASECGYNTKYPNTPNGITDPEYSIDVGIQNLADCLNAAEVENPVDMEHIKLALQGYNFGNGYISWAKNNYGGYSYANAVEFSAIQAERLGWDSYGDTQYVAHVLRYYPYGRAFTSGGISDLTESFIKGVITLDDVLNIVQNNRIVYAPDATMQAMLSDKKGRVLIIEPGLGYRLEKAQYSLITNYSILSPEITKPYIVSGDDRFERADELLKHCNDSFSVAEAFQILKSVKQEGIWATRVSFVYSVNENRVYYVENNDFEYVTKYQFCNSY